MRYEFARITALVKPFDMNHIELFANEIGMGWNPRVLDTFHDIARNRTRLMMKISGRVNLRSDTPDLTRKVQRDLLIKLWS